MQITQKSVNKSIQNECAGGVQGGLGVFTKKAKFAKIAQREISLKPFEHQFH